MKIYAILAVREAGSARKNGAFSAWIATEFISAQENGAFSAWIDVAFVSANEIGIFFSADEQVMMEVGGICCKEEYL